MNTKLLEIGQYIRLHPVLKKNIAFKKSYILLLKSFCISGDDSNLWNSNIWKFYINQILEFNDIRIKNTINEKTLIISHIDIICY